MIVEWIKACPISTRSGENPTKLMELPAIGQLSAFAFTHEVLGNVRQQMTLFVRAA
jgi:hypothetical protein